MRSFVIIIISANSLSDYRYYLLFSKRLLEQIFGLFLEHRAHVAHVLDHAVEKVGLKQDIIILYVGSEAENDLLGLFDIG